MTAEQEREAVVAWLERAAQEEDRRAERNKGTRLGGYAAYAALALRQEATSIRARHHFPDNPQNEG